MTSLRNVFWDSHHWVILVWLFLIMIKIQIKSFTKTLKLLISIVLLQYFLLHQRFQNFHISCACNQFVFMFMIVIFDHDQNQVFIHDFSVFVIHFMIHVSESNHWFSFFTYSIRADCEEWSWWNSFIKADAFFFIIMYDSHVLCSYSSHLIRSSNHVNFVFHFMSLIESTKYEFSSFSTIVSCDDSTCLLIRSSFKSHNKLMWNVEWTFISDDNSSSYV